MAIKLPHPNLNKSSASAPKAPGARWAKSAQIRAFSPSSLGQCWPTHWPAQPAAFRRDPAPIPGASGAPLGPPLGIAGVAELIGCSPWTVRQTLVPRGLPHFRSKASGRLIFYQDQVVRWIESQQQGGHTK